MAHHGPVRFLEHDPDPAPGSAPARGAPLRVNTTKSTQPRAEARHGTTCRVFIVQLGHPTITAEGNKMALPRFMEPAQSNSHAGNLPEFPKPSKGIASQVNAENHGVNLGHPALETTPASFPK